MMIVARLGVAGLQALAPAASILVRATAGLAVTTTSARVAAPELNSQLSHHETVGISAIDLFSQYRASYPDAVWAKLDALFPSRHKHPLLAIDMLPDSRTGAELANRGFTLVSLGEDLSAAPQAAHGVDLVTCMRGGLPLPDAEQATRVAHRILKPGGKLFVGFNDRDLGSEFIDELEALLEAHVPFYSRALAQHTPQQWAPALRRGGLFKLVEYSSLANPLLLDGPATLQGILNSQGWLRGALGMAGPARQRFDAELEALVRRHFGGGPLVLPIRSRIFILDKLDPLRLQ